MKKLIQFGFLSFLLSVMISCSDDSSPGMTGGDDDEMNMDFDIWTGNAIVFTKEDGADPGDQANQDRITDNVWLTRGNQGGQIYNAKVENSADKTASPRGTMWAQGTTANITDLTFSNFRAAVGSPKDVEGKKLVLHLVDDDVYLDIEFTNWSDDKAGGFTYQRSTE